MDIVPATGEALEAIETLAADIWREHYTPIIGSDQVSYMLDKFQSLKAMKKQIAENYLYYGTYIDGQLVGYLGVQPRDGHLFLSKIYFSKTMRGKGLGRKAIDFLVSKARELQLPAIQLTVNKYNSDTITAYEKMGFVKLRAAVFDIGQGYIMDDYVMEKPID